MVEFRTVTLADKAWVDEIVMNENSRSADYNFGNIYIWDKHYRQLVCRCGDRMLTKLRYEGKPTFVFPIGTGSLSPAVEAIREFARFKGKIIFTSNQFRRRVTCSLLAVESHIGRITVVLHTVVRKASNC